MKKLLIATAALAMVAGTAQAQSSVSIYGAYGNGFENREVGTTKTRGALNASEDHLGSTVLGFRGKEDLGGGLTASFQFEGDFSGSGVLGAGATTASVFGGTSAANAAAAGTITNTVTQTNIFNRQANITIGSKEFGSLTVGRQNDSVKDLAGYGQVYNLSDNLFNAQVVSNRIANAYKYSSPTFNGLRATYTYSDSPSNGDQSAADGTYTHNSYAVMYSVQGIDLAYARGEERNVDASLTAKTSTFAAKTKFQGIDFGAHYAVSEQGANELTNTMISVNVPFAGSYEFKANYATSDVTGTDGQFAAIPVGSISSLSVWDGKGYGAMLVKNFSKRTSAYVGYADWDASKADGTKDAKVTTAGLLHKF
jgi:predicted porin